MELNGQLHATAALPPKKNHGTPLNRSLSPRAGVDVMDTRKSLVLPGLDNWLVRLIWLLKVLWLLMLSGITVVILP